MSQSNPQKTGINIDYVANLARIELTPEEKHTFTAQLEQVLGHFDRLNEVDVEGIEPTAHTFPLFNVWTADEPKPGLPVKVALKNAPAQRQNMVVVPKVVE